MGDGLTEGDAERWQRMAERDRNGTAGRIAWRDARNDRAADALLGHVQDADTYRVGE